MARKSYVKADEIQVKGNKIFSPVRQKWLPLTPEERVRQEYHGLGSGIKRALDAWPQIDFIDDRDCCLFTAKVHRKPVDELTLSPGSSKSSPKSSPKTEQRIIELIRQYPYTTTEAMGGILGITKRAVLKQVNKLKAQQRLRRVGPARGGHWEVIE